MKGLALKGKFKIIFLIKKGTINEEKLRLDRAVETNRQKESLQR